MHATPESPWPDVGAPLATEHTGARDAAVVVAIGRYAGLPPVRGATTNGQDFARFFRGVLGVPAERVTELYDRDATRAAILSAVARAATNARPGSRLWLVFIGHGTDALLPADAGDARDPKAWLTAGALLDALRPGSPEPVMIFDLAPPQNALAAPSPPPEPEAPSRPPGIRLAGVRGATLPRAERPAFSYLALGALRGWADGNADGVVTASEVANFVRHAQNRILGPTKTDDGGVVLATPLWCHERSVLSTLHERPPNLQQLAAGLRVRAPANPEALLRMRSAIGAADAELEAEYALNRQAGDGHGVLERREPTFTGEGELRRLDVVPMPPAAEHAAAVRVAEAKRLGGPGLVEAAAALLEGGHLYLAYGQARRAWEVVHPILDEQCGATEVGYRAWELLITIAVVQDNRDAARELAVRDCSYDAASEDAYENMRQPHGSREMRALRVLYARAQKEPDPDVARCEWSRVAADYAEAARSTRGEAAAEPALNGAYAWLNADHLERAATTYRDYVRAHARPPGVSREADAEHRYAVDACRELRSIVTEFPALAPVYGETCTGKPWKGPGDDETAAFVPEDSPKGRAATALHAAEGRAELAGWITEGRPRAAERAAALDGLRAAATVLEGLFRDAAARDPGGLRLRLAEALSQIVLVQVAGGMIPNPADVAAARDAARAARDGTAGDRRLSAARMLVELADGLARTSKRNDGPHFEETGGARRPIREDIPALVLDTIRAREEYLAHVGPTEDGAGAWRKLAVEAAWAYVGYGHFEEARLLLEPFYAAWCGHVPEAIDALEVLLTITTFQPDATRAMALTQGPSCAVDPETRTREGWLVKPMRGLPYANGEQLVRAADRIPNGADRDLARRNAAATLVAELRLAPERQDAPEAALLAATIYRELGETARAHDMLDTFLTHYGSADALARLSKQDPQGIRSPAYRERLDRTLHAYDLLATLERETLAHRAAFVLRVEESRRGDLPQPARRRARAEALELARLRGAPPPR